METINVTDDTILKTIPINTFSSTTGQIKSFASCSIVQYKGKDIVLTVAHCMDDNRLIGINLGAYQGQPNILFFRPYPVKIMRIRTGIAVLSRFKSFLKPAIKSFDDIFATNKSQYDMLYADIPPNIVPRHPVIDSPLFNKPKKKIPIRFPIMVNKMDFYQFYGLCFKGFSDGMIKFENISASDMRFIKNDGDDFYIFKSKQLPERIDGCSGAPILDKGGQIVSMVVRYKKGRIWGLNLNKLCAIFDASYDRSLYGQ